jgi:hypothetical protein
MSIVRSSVALFFCLAIGSGVTACAAETADVEGPEGDPTATSEEAVSLGKCSLAIGGAVWDGAVLVSTVAGAVAGCTGTVYTVGAAVLYCVIPAAGILPAASAALDSASNISVQCGSSGKKALRKSCAASTYNSLYGTMQTTCNRFIGSGERCSQTSCNTIDSRVALGKKCVAAETQIMGRCNGMTAENLGNYRQMTSQLSECEKRATACP